MTEPQLLEGVAGKEGVNFFHGGGGGLVQQFSHKEIKSEIFNDKKSLLAKIFFSVLTKNLNWEILTKNLVTFKR